MDVQLGDQHSLTTSEINEYGKLFTLVMTLGILAIPVVGACMDTVGFPATSFATTVFGSIWALLLLESTSKSVMGSFVMYTLFRTFLFTFLFAYLADSLGFKYFGVLAGMVFVFSGLCYDCFVRSASVFL